MDKLGTFDKEPRSNESLDHKIIRESKNLFDKIKNLDKDGDNLENSLDEDGNFKDIDEHVEDDDSDIIRIKLTKALAEQLFDENAQKDMQISRLNPQQITWLTWMKFTDRALGFDLYEEYANALRIHQISLHGFSRKEIVALVKAMSNNDGMMESGSSGNRGLFNSIKNRLFG